MHTRTDGWLIAIPLAGCVAYSPHPPSTQRPTIPGRRAHRLSSQHTRRPAPYYASPAAQVGIPPARAIGPPRTRRRHSRRPARAAAPVVTAASRARVAVTTEWPPARRRRPCRRSRLRGLRHRARRPRPKSCRAPAASMHSEISASEIAMVGGSGGGDDIDRHWSGQVEDELNEAEGEGG